MKFEKVKLIYIVAALLTLVAIFALEFVNLLDEGAPTLWALTRNAPKAEKSFPYIFVVVAAVPALLAALTLKKTYAPRWQSALALICGLFGMMMLLALFVKIGGSSRGLFNEFGLGFSTLFGKGEIGALALFVAFVAIIGGAMFRMIRPSNTTVAH